MSADEESSPIVYVVALGRWGTSDISGVSCDAERVWFEHVSSSMGWLVRDTTTGFTDRREQLEAAYPGGFRTVLVGPGDEMPREIAHHFGGGPEESVVRT